MFEFTKECLNNLESYERTPSKVYKELRDVEKGVKKLLDLKKELQDNIKRLEEDKRELIRRETQLEWLVSAFKSQLQEQEPYVELGKAVEFIRVSLDESGFTYSDVTEIMFGYKKRLNDEYNSYTMNQMIDHCLESLEILYPYWYRNEVNNEV